MEQAAKVKGHIPASLRVRQGVASISALLALQEKAAPTSAVQLNREDCEGIEAGDERVPMEKVRAYGALIRADMATMVAALALARTVPRITAKTLRKPAGRKARAS